MLVEKEVRDELLKVLNKIKNRTVIVEGARDRAALRSLGFKQIVTVHRGLWETAEAVEGKAVILTDFDAEGRRIAARLNLFLRNRADQNMRRKIGLLFAKLKIKTVEELKTIKGDDYNGEISTSRIKIHNIRTLRG
ncbi:MAG: hypothetical protein QW751_01790 [Candidatus Aenigmatarchaeota archaeon]|nr:toprim domain-containing protein [Candidatus Aenigmarchaeota archaeon]